MAARKAAAERGGVGGGLAAGLTMLVQKEERKESAGWNTARKAQFALREGRAVGAGAQQLGLAESTFGSQPQKNKMNE